MKKLSCILLAVMLITALFVSCTAEVIDPYDGLAYVTFGGPASKDLSASYEVQSYEDLYWFYTATKTDAYGKTGETSDKTPLAGTAETPAKGLGGKIGPFSQGTWNFELFAYSNSEKADGTLVYKGSVEGIKLTSSSLTSVPVSVTPQGETGTIEFRNAFFKWAGDSGNGKPNIRITVSKEDGTEAYVLRSDISENSGKQIVLQMGGKEEDGKFSIDQIYGEVDAGYYKCDVEAWFVVDETTYTIFKSEKSFGIRVYGSAKTVVSGDITEAVDSEIIFTPNTNLPNLSVFKGLSQISVDATPSNSEDQKTTIDFGANLEADKTYSLQVATSDTLAAAEKFVVTSEQAAVAGIDLTLTNTTNNITVTQFDSEITITTYISTGLSGVKVLYGNDGKDYLKSYNSSTGELIFATNHFSEFYVVSDAVASIGSTGYAFLQDAIDAANDGDVITVIGDIEVKETVKVCGNKQITLNLNGKKVFNKDVELEKTWSLISVRENAQLTIEGDGTLQAKENDCFAADVYDFGAKLIINGGTFIGNNHTIYVWGGDLIVNGGYFSVQRPSSNPDKFGYILNCYDLNYKNESAKIVVTGGRFEKFDPADCSAEGSHTNFVAEGYISVRSEDENSYTVRKLAEGEKAVADYETLKEAVKEDGTIIITNDIIVDDTIAVVGKSVVLNMNGKTLSNTKDLWSETTGNWSLISVRNNGNLTITGNGTLKAKDGDCFAVDAWDGSIAIENGTFIGNVHAVYIQKGKAEIKGGEYSIQQVYSQGENKDYEFVLNCYDANRAEGTASIIVSGGTFVNFNPANCQAEGDGTNFVKDGCTVTSKGKGEDTLYTVTVVK